MKLINIFLKKKRRKTSKVLLNLFKLELFTFKSSEKKNDEMKMWKKGSDTFLIIFAFPSINIFYLLNFKLDLRC